MARVVARVLALSTAAVVATVGGPGALRPSTVAALGQIIVVDTTADAEFPADGKCSLRAAIIASNVGGFAGYCGAGSTDRDSIRFNLGSGTPTIDLASGLPSITDDSGVTIAGNTGGATRIRIHGPGNGTGLTVDGPGSTLRNLVVDGWATGISIIAASVSLTASVIGPNTTWGVYLLGSSATIGGTNGVTPGGACTGDCNVISGNAGAGLGLSGGGTIQGNHIGTDAAGTAAVPNGTGISGSGGGPWQVGGTASGAGNLISGNTGNGVSHAICSACTYQGNLVGTTANGNAALPNGGDGIWLDYHTDTVVGGTTAGAGNVVAGNTGNGLVIRRGVRVNVQGNWIGVTASLAALGNGGDGIRMPLFDSVDPGTTKSRVGSATVAGAANVIARNGGAGVRVIGVLPYNSARENEIAGNSIHDNGGAGIVIDGANGGIAPPTITALGPVTGTACASCYVDVYSDNQDEGLRFEGRTQADGGGSWAYTGLFAGPHVTAVQTDANHNSSAFSPAFAIPATPFTDIGASGFKTEIEWLYANRITLGCAPTKFCPADSVTREQMASFIARMFQLPPTGTDYFTDDETSSHEDNINRLAAAGITTGCTATTFCPKDLVKRDQMASFLARAAELTTGVGRNYFSDDNGNTHEPNIDRIAAAGITTGCGAYLYCPSSAVTREQMAAFLRRVLVPASKPPYPAP